MKTILVRFDGTEPSYSAKFGLSLKPGIQEQPEAEARAAAAVGLVTIVEPTVETEEKTLPDSEVAAKVPNWPGGILTRGTKAQDAKTQDGRDDTGGNKG